MIGVSTIAKKVNDFIVLEPGKYDDEKKNRTWGNKDLDPTPPSQRTWNGFQYFFVFWAVSFNPNQYNTGASLVNQGLLWWQATVAISISCVICSFALVLMSRGPAKYHIGFPAYIRIASGMYGSMFFIFLRLAVASIFFAVQSYFAGQLTDTMLHAIFGHKWQNIPNHIPASQHFTTRQMVAYLIYWLIQFPFMWIHPERAKWLFTVKSILVPPVIFATFGYVIAKNGGSMGHADSLTTTKLTSSQTGWAFMAAMNSVAGTTVPEIMSNADLARYAIKASYTGIPQFIGLSSARIVVIFLGIASASAAKSVYGTAYWNMWDLYNAILEHNWNSGARCAVALACFVQMLAVVATNLNANCLPVGADLSGLFPKYFTIVRGQILCATLAWPLVPWRIVGSAQDLLTFLGSCTCFLGSLIGIAITDYFLIRKGNIHIPSLYVCGPENPYYYFKGFNIRTYISWVAGTIITIHGLSGSYNITAPQVSKHFYSLGFLVSFCTGSVFYFVINYFFPPPIYPQQYEDCPKTFEYLAETDGYFPEDSGIEVEEDGRDESLTKISDEKSPFKSVVVSATP